MKQILIIFVALLLFTLPNVLADDEFNTCTNITSPGLYVLNSTIYSDEDYCININSDNVFIDCNYGELGMSYIIANKASLDQSYHKININRSSNVTLKDCILEYGHIYLEGNSQVNLSIKTENLTFDANINASDCWVSYYGDYYNHGRYNICPGYYEINFSSPGYSWMYLDGDSEINGTGVVAHGGGHSNFIDMTFYDSVATSNNSAYGFKISNFGVGLFMATGGGSFHDMQLDNNIYGIFILGSLPPFFNGTSNAEMYNLNVSNNGRGGVFAFATYNMTIFDNEFNDNGFGLVSADPYTYGYPVGNASFGFVGFETGLINNSQFLRNKNIGLFIVGTNFTVSNNNISTNEGIGIFVANAVQDIGSSSDIVSNEISYNKMTGLFAIGGNNNVYDNKIIGNGDGITLVDEATMNALEFAIEFFGYNFSFSKGNIYWWNGITSMVSLTDNDYSNLFESNVILDNYNYGILFINSTDADLYNNIICNNSKSGLNLSQISIDTSAVINANESDPYNNIYCENNPSWFEYSRVLQLIVSPADANTNVTEYLTNTRHLPIQSTLGQPITYLLPTISYYNGTFSIQTPYLWSVSKNGYVTQQGLTSLDADETITVNLVAGYTPSIICSANSTTQICQLLSETGAGLGGFMDYIGGPLMLLLIILILLAIIAMIGFSVVTIFQREVK